MSWKLPSNSISTSHVSQVKPNFKYCSYIWWAALPNDDLPPFFSPVLFTYSPTNSRWPVTILWPLPQINTKANKTSYAPIHCSTSEAQNISIVSFSMLKNFLFTTNRSSFHFLRFSIWIQEFLFFSRSQKINSCPLSVRQCIPKYW